MPTPYPNIIHAQGTERFDKGACQTGIRDERDIQVDATIQFHAQKLYVETVRRIKRISKQIEKELNISGPFNIQYLAKGNEIKVIECNLRASRSFPFVSKVLKINFIELARDIQLFCDLLADTLDAADRFNIQLLCGKLDSCIAGMHTGKLDMFGDGR